MRPSVSSRVLVCYVNSILRDSQRVWCLLLVSTIDFAFSAGENDVRACLFHNCHLRLIQPFDNFYMAVLCRSRFNAIIFGVFEQSALISLATGASRNQDRTKTGRELGIVGEAFRICTNFKVMQQLCDRYIVPKFHLFT